MIKLNLIKNALIFFIVYIPPLIVFGKHWLKRERNKIILAIISILYVVLCFHTQNIVPFLFVIYDIVYMRFTDEFYVFNIRRFNFFKCLKAAVFSYLVTISILLFERTIASNLNFNLNNQQIVTNMIDMSLKRVIFMVPLVVICAPVLEEFIFRWLFFEKIFKNRIGIYFSAILSSVIFSVVHFSLAASMVIFWIGIYNCYLIHKKGYWYAVFNHAFFNSITMMIIISQKI